MYQLGLSPVTAEVPSMSAVALGANRWASRVVVVLQLAAWSAVGIVLLQKGVSSLQKTPVDVKNVTKANYNDTAVANLVMKRVFLEGESEEDYSKNVVNSGNPIGPVATDETMGKFIPPVIPLGSLTPNHLSDEIKKPVWIQEKISKTNSPGEEKDEVRDSESTTSPLPHTVSSSSEKYETVFEVRKRLKTSNLSGVGGAAAAAVAMVAVGAVMLVLGPVVIILRALDERRQERRFLKLSGQDDLPPSYEQATLMDEAPRYSTLSLNTIGSSPAANGTSSSSEVRSSSTGGDVPQV